MRSGTPSSAPPSSSASGARATSPERPASSRSGEPLKNVADLRIPLFLTLEDLERRLAPALAQYTYFRPHRGLHGATPAEAFLGLVPACKKARRAPRGRPGEGTLEVPFAVAFLDDPEKRFPVLLPAAA